MRQSLPHLVGYVGPFRDVAQEQLGAGLLELRVCLDALVRALYVLRGDVAYFLAELLKAVGWKCSYGAWAHQVSGEN